MGPGQHAPRLATTWGAYAGSIGDRRQGRNAPRGGRRGDCRAQPTVASGEAPLDRRSVGALGAR
jgi:hypothetical protein